MLAEANARHLKVLWLEIWETLRLKSTKAYDQLAGKTNVKGSNSRAHECSPRLKVDYEHHNNSSTEISKLEPCW